MKEEAIQELRELINSIKKGFDDLENESVKSDTRTILKAIHHCRIIDTSIHALVILLQGIEE